MMNLLKDSEARAEVEKLCAEVEKLREIVTDLMTRVGELEVESVARPRSHFSKK
jgi:hypothetical protein